MEKVHNPSHRAWIDDKVFNVGAFLNDWMNTISLESPESKGKTSLECLVSEEFPRIEKLCGLDIMRCHHQEKVEPAYEITVPNDVHLNTIRRQAEDLEKRANNAKYFGTHYVSMKFPNYPPHKILNVDLTSFDYVPVDTPEVVLTVQICTPERRLDSKVSVNYTRMPSFHVDQEFLVLGCQFLTELRDKIDCLSDKAISGEYSDSPNFLPSVTCKDIYKSGFFYIGGVFYNDMRDKDCRDYSEPIIKWSNNGKRGIGPFRKACLEKSQFKDLTIQLGYPYVYVHQGECEHLIIFSDIRLFSENDVNNRNAYPLYVQVKPLKRIFCMVCHEYTATWVVYDNKRLPENPFFFCKSCFFSFNYDSNHQKIGEFRAYHFPDRTKLF